MANDSSWMAPSAVGAKPSLTMQTCDEDDQAAMESVLNRGVAACDIDEVDKNLAFAEFGAPKTGKRAAFFDLDGTLCASNVVSQYAVAKLANMPAWLKLFWVPFYACKCLVYLIVDKFSRTAFNNMFFGDFAGMDASEKAKAEMARLVYDEYTSPRVFPAAVEAIAGCDATGTTSSWSPEASISSWSPSPRPSAPRTLIANALEEKDEKFTGKLVGPPSRTTRSGCGSRRTHGARGTTCRSAPRTGTRTRTCPCWSASATRGVVSLKIRFESRRKRRVGRCWSGARRRRARTGARPSPPDAEDRAGEVMYSGVG